MAGSVILDKRRTESFKNSLISLRHAMKQRQSNRKASGGGGGSTLDASGGLRQASASPTFSGGVSSSSLPSPMQSSSSSSSGTKRFVKWIRTEREGVTWILGCALLGALLGFAVGAGWLTAGSGTYKILLREKRSLGAMSAKAGRPGRRALKRFVVSAWRVNLASRVRKTLAYQIMTLRKAPWRIAFDFAWSVLFSQRNLTNQNWIGSPLWPPNWILFREVDLSQIDVGEGGLSPTLVSALSFVLPWRRSLLRALARKDRTKVSLRDREGGGAAGGGAPIPVTSSQSAAAGLRPSSSSFASSVISSTPSGRPVNPYYHPMAFHTLREYVIRFDEGYVHPDLGFLVPAPSGAERGLGMIRDTYNKCQVHCFPGTAEEKLTAKRDSQAFLEKSKQQEIVDKELMEEMMKEYPEMEEVSGLQKHNHHVDTKADPIRNTTTYEGIQAAVQLQSNASTHPPYGQSEVLLRIPLEAQVTRATALESLQSLLTSEGGSGTRSTQLDELDDAFVLALYLAHERGLGSGSRIWPYVATLPLRPTCALHWGWRQSVVDVVTAMSVEMGTDVQGWPNEIGKAAEVSERIVASLSRSWADKLATRPGADDVAENVRWAICQVASRAVAGRGKHGSLRLVPVMDMINHDEAAGKFIELTGTERMEEGHFIDAEEGHSGTFVVRSTRHGERKRLRRGQELMANYNVPAYSPLDWFLNMGYIPPERVGKWTMLEAGLPQSYRGGFSRKSNAGVAKDSGAFGSGKPEIQVIRQHTQQQSCSR